MLARVKAAHTNDALVLGGDIDNGPSGDIQGSLEVDLYTDPVEKKVRIVNQNSSKPMLQEK